MNNGDFTPTQQAMLNVLRDGKNHLKSELQKCLPDPEGNKDNIKVHICHMRRELKHYGQDIVCVIDHRRASYRLVRIFSYNE